MLNLFVEFRFQLFDMVTLLNFKLGITAGNLKLQRVSNSEQTSRFGAL